MLQKYFTVYWYKTLKPKEIMINITAVLTISLTSSHNQWYS